MKSLYNCLFICWSTAIILTLISTSVPSANAGGGRRKVGGHNGIDRRGWQKLPIRPEDQSTSSRGRGRGSRKKASGMYPDHLFSLFFAFVLFCSAFQIDFMMKNSKYYKNVPAIVIVITFYNIVTGSVNRVKFTKQFTV